MAEKLLIANRGEIACRIIRTARRMGLRTVAVHSEADRGALHVLQADEALEIGPPAPADSYLKIEAILEAARRSGAGAVHPGYGFLSENAQFAEACAAAGLVFVGPPPAAIRAMGSKSEAKALMARAGVPLLPGYHGEGQDEVRLLAAAAEIGYPLLIKASAGGGGKGMRLVERAAEFSTALAGARRESAAAFGDERMLLEKYLTTPRHIEIQICVDNAGQGVHLFERDCSLQRRHQKVIEEAPAPGLSPERRAEMGEAALAAARTVDYRGAGTVEFICQDDAFYFMEMNTRLQVEHPVTEMVTGVDLVEWQLRIARGEALPLGQADLAPRGHAVEARLYAEDPEREFLPATGRLNHLYFPAGIPGVRIESGVRQGDEVTVHYDPMIAKLVAWGEDRAAALDRLSWVLGETRVAGLATNLNLLRRLAAHPEFAAGGVDTGFIARHRENLIVARGEVPEQVLALAALGELLRRKREAAKQARRSADPHSPWHAKTGWRLNVASHSRLTFFDGARLLEVVVEYRGEGYEFTLPGSKIRAHGSLDDDGRLAASLDGHGLKATLVRDGHELTVVTAEASHTLRLRDALEPEETEDGGSDRVLAPMPGRVVQVLVAAGAEVERGDALMVLEAMKMEHTVLAPEAGRVVEIHFATGDSVEEGVDLLLFEAGK